MPFNMMLRYRYGSLLTLLFLAQNVIDASGQRNTTFQPFGSPYRAPVNIHPLFQSRLLFSNLTSPRSILVDPFNNLLVVEQGFGVSAFRQVVNNATQSNGTIQSLGGWERTVVIRNENVTHGIELDSISGVLYVDTPTQILAYSGYDPQTRAVDELNDFQPYPLIVNIPTDGISPLHNILFEHDRISGILPPTPSAVLITTSSSTNLNSAARDPSTGVSQIRRFVFPDIQIEIYPPPSFDWIRDGEVLAYGLRNPGGIAWGQRKVDSGNGQKAGILFVTDVSPNLSDGSDEDGFASDFEDENPADELNYLVVPSAQSSPASESSGNNTSTTPLYFGYPDCATIYQPLGSLAGGEKGDQFSLNLPFERENRTDEWCREEKNNIPPALSFEAHSEPQSIAFQNVLSTLSGAHLNHSFPTDMFKEAFVALHGADGTSSDEGIGGFGVVHIPYPPTDNTTYSYLIQAHNITSCLDQDGHCIRPVGLAFGYDSKLYVTSDRTGELFVIERNPNASVVA